MSKNKQGYYLRARTVPSNPNTLSQQAIRTAFAALTPAWSSLTQSQQANWNLYAKNVSVVLNNGQTRILSGFNWFVGANQLRLQASEDVQNDAPTVMTMAQSPYGIEAFYTGMNTMAVRFNLLDAPDAPGSGDQLLIQIGRPQTLGTLYFKSPYQFVGTIDSYDAGSYVTLDVTNFSAYEAAYNQSQWMRITRILPDGRYSTPTTYGPFRGYGAPDSYGFGAQPVVIGTLLGVSTANVPHNAGTLTGVTTIQAGSDALTYSIVGGTLLVSSSGGVTANVTGILEVTGSLGTQTLVLSIPLEAVDVLTPSGITGNPDQMGPQTVTCSTSAITGVVPDPAVAPKIAISIDGAGMHVSWISPTPATYVGTWSVQLADGQQIPFAVNWSNE